MVYMYICIYVLERQLKRGYHGFDVSLRHGRCNGEKRAIAKQMGPTWRFFGFKQLSGDRSPVDVGRRNT